MTPKQKQLVEAAAEAYTWPNWPQKTDFDRPERYESLMNYEIGYEVNEAFEAGAAYGIELERERSAVLIRAINDYLEIQRLIAEPEIDDCASSADFRFALAAYEKETI